MAVVRAKGPDRGRWEEDKWPLVAHFEALAHMVNHKITGLNPTFGTAVWGNFCISREFSIHTALSAFSNTRYIFALEAILPTVHYSVLLTIY